MKERDYIIGNIDCTIIAQKPKLSPHKVPMGLVQTGCVLHSVREVTLTTYRLYIHGRRLFVKISASCWKLILLL